MCLFVFHKFLLHGKQSLAKQTGGIDQNMSNLCRVYLCGGCKFSCSVRSASVAWSNQNSCWVSCNTMNSNLSLMKRLWPLRWLPTNYVANSLALLFIWLLCFFEHLAYKSRHPDLLWWSASSGSCGRNLSSQSWGHRFDLWVHYYLDLSPHQKPWYVAQYKYILLVKETTVMQMESQ